MLWRAGKTMASGSVVCLCAMCAVCFVRGFSHCHWPTKGWAVAGRVVIVGGYRVWLDVRGGSEYGCEEGEADLGGGGKCVFIRILITFVLADCTHACIHYI